MASAGKWFCHLEVVYLPYLQKYLRYEDFCQACTDDANKGQDVHIDIWTGSTKHNGGNLQVSCEDTLTPGSMQTMVRNPSPDLPANGKFSSPTVFGVVLLKENEASDLFTPNGRTGTCNGTVVNTAVTHNRPGRWTYGLLCILSLLFPIVMLGRSDIHSTLIEVM
jgi:hypothetical protein